MKITQKFLAKFLILLLLLNGSMSYIAAGKVYAQESTPGSGQTQDSQSVQESPSPEPSPSPSPAPSPSASPSATTTNNEGSPSPSASSAVSSPAPSLQPTIAASPTPTPFDPYVRPPYSSKEYDVWKVEYRKWKEEQERLDDERERLEDIWEANEKNKTWVAAHGGNEEYFVSGRWQKDQDAAAAAAAAQTKISEYPLLESSNGNLGQNNCSNASQNGYYGSQGQTLPGSTQGTVDNTAVSSGTRDAAVYNDNCAGIYNSSTAGGYSGYNNQTYNDGPADMQTGSSSADGRLVNQGNSNVVSTDNFSYSQAETNGSFAQGADAENFSTGADSENLSSATQSDTLSVVNSNQAYVNNELAVEGVSGVNTVSENDGNVKLTTGDIQLIANLLNILNLNITGKDFLHLIVNIFGSLNGPLDLDDIALILGYSDDDELEVIAKNVNTGENSKNTAVATKEQNTNISNTNTAEVNNEMNVSGVSGRNDVSRNDGGADVITGRIKILANLMNFINANFSGEKWSFIMINVFGSLVGDIFLPGTANYLTGGAGSGAVAANTNPGEGSVNNQSATSIENTSVTNTNDIGLTNNINAYGASGNNQQNGNDDGSGAHTMGTGQVDVATRLMNFLNFNITGNNWVFLIVNVFGTWMGKIVGFPGIAEVNSSQESFAALRVGGNGAGGVSATNSNTGEGSINNAEASLAVDTDITNQNSAKVVNNMNIEGVSGENMVNNNDAGTSLITGWVEIDANLLNIINMNVAGRSWMIVFLNVFGDFFGDLFFGRPPEPPHLAQEPAFVQESSMGGGEAVASIQNNNMSAGANTVNTANPSSGSSGGQVSGQSVSGRISGLLLSLKNKKLKKINKGLIRTISFSSSEGTQILQVESVEQKGGLQSFIQEIVSYLTKLFSFRFAHAFSAPN